MALGRLLGLGEEPFLLQSVKCSPTPDHATIFSGFSNPYWFVVNNFGKQASRLFVFWSVGRRDDPSPVFDFRLSLRPVSPASCLLCLPPHSPQATIHCGDARRLTPRLMSVILSDMKTVTTREIQRGTRAVRQRLLAGETLQWMLGKKVIGHIMPAQEAATAQPWPDLQRRLQHIYQRPVGAKQPAAAQIYADRG